MRHAEDLLAWFDRHRRDLPWRRTRDPYRIWLSEVMLQQTRVEVVIPYYDRFLDRFPAVEQLAAAALDEVLALWSGLGYYRRARQLHAAAQRIAAGGRGFPRTLDELRSLPGIGEYTAAAVASQAFDLPVPVLDGNVERVLARWLGMGEDPKSSAGRRRLLAAAAALLDRERPGDSNQGLMELGATLCTPRRPKCLLCPIAGGCRAAAGGNPELYPVARLKRPAERTKWVVAVVEDGGGGTLLFRRPDDSEILAGTWELPWVDGDAGEPAQALAARYGGSWRLGPQVGQVRHGITFRDLEVAVHRGEVEAAVGAREGREAGWFDDEGRAGLPLSSLVGKVLKELGSAISPAPRPARRSPSRRRG